MNSDRLLSKTFAIVAIRWLTLINVVVLNFVWTKPWSFQIFAVIVTYNLFITVSWNKLSVLAKKYPQLLMIDLTIALAALWFTGTSWKSPYYPYCLLSLTTTIFFMGLKKGLYALFYVASLYTAGILLNAQVRHEMLTRNNEIYLFSSYLGFILTAVFFGLPANIVHQIEKEQEEINQVEGHIKQAKSLIDSIDKSEAELSNRELEILEKLSQGKTNKQIAEELHLSENTVKNHLYRIYKKMGVNSRTAAIIYYHSYSCLLYTSPSPRDRTRSRMPSSA
jgi:DNA-binding CsgD family transcriptional regulator